MIATRVYMRELRLSAVAFIAVNEYNFYST
jgi:hypothetical protein